MRRFVLLGTIAAAFAFPLQSAAHAVTLAATGERCTIVGTSRAEVLQGSSGRDIICGLGGDDVIRGAGGNDVLDGGTGRDRIAGGPGDDRIFGGQGNDTVYGGPGADRINAGADNDKSYGDTGADSVAGGAGNDLVSGGDGRDRLYGGPANDTLLGGENPDHLSGDSGNDDLDGQEGGDGLDGGDGTNWCTIGAEDTSKACVYDRSAPQALDVEVLPATVDVSEGEQEVRLRVHVIDDTGTTWVYPRLQPLGHATARHEARLVSGTRRDGWWETVLDAPRYAHPGRADVDVWFTDRVGRETYQTFAGAIEFVNDDPDLDHPVVSDVVITPARIDVRSGQAEVTVTARIVDPKAGLIDRTEMSGSGAPDVELWGPSPDGSLAPLEYSLMYRASGTRFDGVYRAHFYVDEAEAGGIWSASIRVDDATFGNSHAYVGPTMWAYISEQWGEVGDYWSKIEGADLEVLGATEFDRTPPQVTKARIDRTTVDTLGRSQHLVLDVDVTDVGDGVRGVTASLVSDNGFWVQGYGHLESGTESDGTWRMWLTLPQGTPPGRYVLDSIDVRDRYNHEDFSAPAVEYSHGDLPDGTFTTADGAPWDGVITVIDNPAAG